MRTVNPVGCPNFLNKDTRFKQLRGAMDTHFQLHARGIGQEVKHSEVFSDDEEQQLWRSGVLGTNTPKSLQNAVFYTVGKVFCLRSGKEHRDVKTSQFQRKSDPNCYVYTEHTSKNRNGTFQQLHIKNKIVPVCACPEAGEQCPVYSMDFYLSKLPKEAYRHDLFYVRPLESTPTDPTNPWYSSQPVGKNALQMRVRQMCSSAGIKEKKSNYSLRATGATQMYSSGVPEKLIQERTGHQSLEALRLYERTNIQQHKAVSSVQSSHSHTYSKEPATITTPATPGVSFQNLYGCTINILNGSTCPSNNPPASTAEIDLTESEIDQLFASITEPV